MESSSFGIAIMAAGKGTRLNSRRPKVLHEIGGQALLLHVIAAAKTIAPADHIYCIIGHEADKVREAVKSTGVSFVLQTEQRGTGHALQQLKAHFTDSKLTPPENLLVLSGDVPLIQPGTLEALCAFHQVQHAAMTILTAVPPNPQGYGRVLRKSESSPEVTAIVEQKSLTPDQLSAPEINSGIYCFRTSALFTHLDSLSTNNAHGEFYLTDIATLLVTAGDRVVALKSTGSIDEVLGANTIEEMMHLDAAMRLATARRLMAQGVTIYRPDTCVIDSQVEIGPDTIIQPYVQLLGRTKVGSECHIASHNVVQDAQIASKVLLRPGCVITEATIATGAKLGPYAHLRPGTEIGEESHIGNFVETKNTKIGRNSKANHLSYLGDATIGEGVNIGAGTITCNYDGQNKHQTKISNNAFIGSNSTLVSPLSIGDSAYVAAASCITEDVPADALALGRSRQTTKPGWVTARKQAAKQCD
ncbi:MAG: bifunctional UDP-N-acetylglucosamine diphosphorylase/glucosamine-1-phosphate N-acetyltransferase GlmU [Acidobacteriaceae bacterium]